MQSAKSVLKRILLPKGLRRRRVMGGALKGYYFNIDLRTDTQVWRGIYERDLQAWLVKYTPRGGVCLDIGAAEGLISLVMASRAGPTGAVHAFEPSERGEQIIPNFNLNSGRSLAPMQVHTSFVGAVSNHGARAISIDDFIEESALRSVDIVKIDVDGVEEEVLAGMTRTITKYHPHLSVEVHSKKLLDAVLKICDGNGYHCSILQPPSREHRPIEFNPTVYAIAPR